MAAISAAPGKQENRPLSLEIHFDSTEIVHLPVIDEHPTLGPVVLSASGVEVALPASSAAPSVWITTSWASGTWRQGDRRWYMAELDLSDFTLSAGTTYQPWVRIGGSNGAIVKTAGTIKAINT